MRVLHITYNNRGGGGIAAVRLHQALLKNGVDSKLLTLTWQGPDIPGHYLYRDVDVASWPLLAKFLKLIDRALKRFKLKTDYYRTFKQKHLEGKPEGFDLFSFDISEHKIDKHPLVKQADVIHLHWVSGGLTEFCRFFPKLRNQIVWTLHDMNPFTGGCHHADDCRGYLADCHDCPQMRGTVDPGIAQKTLARKKAALSVCGAGLTIVAPSKWLLARSQSSALFKRLPHHHIYNVYDDAAFYPSDMASNRQELSLPLDKKIILCVAHIVGNSRKGNRILIDALARLHTRDVILCTVGSLVDEWEDNPSIIQLGYIDGSEQMRKVYGAADVFALPSKAENFPNTVIESHRCGTPVVAFDVGGIPEQITEANGVLVRQRDAQSLAAGLDQFFEHEGSYDREKISRVAMDRYSVDAVLDKHMDLYKSLTGEFDAAPAAG